MKQKYMVMVLLALIGAASLTSFHSYRATEQIVTSDMNQALALALAEQKTDVINSDTIQVFNSYLQLEQLKGQAVLAVDTRQRGFHCYAKCSTATIFSMSEQRPAFALWTLAMLWAAFCFFYRQRKIPLLTGLQQYGGLNYSAREGRFFDGRARQTDAYATAVDGDVLPLRHASADEDGDLRCPLAQERRRQRNALHPDTSPEAHHRATFRPENRVRQRSRLRTERQIVSHLSTNCQTNVRQIICHFRDLFIPLHKKAQRV